MERQARGPRGQFTDYYQDALARLRRMGLSPAQVAALRRFGLLATDNVTGFHEGRSGRGRFATLRRAIRHVKRTGAEAYYVEMDLQNLSGLNAALGHTAANRVYARVAAILRRELSAVAAAATFFRHGGDETSAFLIDATGEAVRAALRAAQSRIGRLAVRLGLGSIPHPKHPGNPSRRGIGVHFGVCRLSAAHEKDPAAVFRQADTELERRKEGTGPSRHRCVTVARR